MIDGFMDVAQKLKISGLESSDKSEINMKINELLRKSDGLFRCRSCGKSSKDKTNMKRHVETHIEGLTYSCQICDN